MRLAVAGIVSVVIAAALSGCVSVEPDDAAERALAGAALGSAFGAGFGATLAIDPVLGAIIGAESGAVVGAAIGAATAQPSPDYQPITPPSEAVIPHFYETWAPGNYVPSVAARVPPPPPG